MNAIAKIWISPNHSFLLKSNYRNMNNAFNFEFVQLEAILCYVWCVCPAQVLFTHILFIRCTSFVFSLIWLDFHKRLLSCFVACFTSSVHLFEHSFICSLARKYQRTYTYVRTTNIYNIRYIIKYSVTKAYILTASNELHKIKFNQ